jgi:hypothetical protein
MTAGSSFFVLILARIVALRRTQVLGTGDQEFRGGVMLVTVYSSDVVFE